MNDYNSTAFRDWFKKLLNNGGLYLGPACVVEEKGSYFVSASTDGAHFLLHGLDGKLRAFLNVCRHREKQIIVPKSNDVQGRVGKLTSGFVSCSGHDWTYATDGTHVSPKKFVLKNGSCPIVGDFNLHEVPIENIGGLIWTGSEAELAEIRELLMTPLLEQCCITDFLPPDYRLHEIWISPDQYRPDTGMEVFGDISHVLAPAVHGGTLMRFVDPTELRLDAPRKSRCGNVQMVPFLLETNHSKMTDAWRAYREAVLEHCGSEVPEYGAIWIAHYHDGTTIEYFPYAIVVSRFAPDPLTDGTRNVVEFYFSEFFPEIAALFTAAYKELAHEDAELCAEMDRGSKFLSLYGKGKLKSGPAHPTEEWAVSHYEKWLQERWVDEKRRLSIEEFPLRDRPFR